MEFVDFIKDGQIPMAIGAVFILILNWLKQNDAVYINRLPDWASTLVTGLIATTLSVLTGLVYGADTASIVSMGTGTALGVGTVGAIAAPRHVKPKAKKESTIEV